MAFYGIPPALWCRSITFPAYLFISGMLFLMRDLYAGNTGIKKGPRRLRSGPVSIYQVRNHVGSAHLFRN